MSLRFVSAALGRLVDAVDGADGFPTRDAREAWQQTKESAEAGLHAWAEFKTREVEPVIGPLERSGL
jgi:hypothetical protein